MTIKGLLGRKIGMTTVYREDGESVAATAIEVGPCVVTQVKTKARDGYEAVQLGFGSARNLSKPELGHLARSNGRFQHLREYKVADLGEFEVGKTLKADVFKAGDMVRVTGTSRGHGFQGGVKRHHFNGGPRTHGQSDRLRTSGAIGSTTHPGHVWRGTRMAGHMGNVRSTVRGLEVLLADPERNLVFIRGAVPGWDTGIVSIEITGVARKKPVPQAKKAEGKPPTKAPAAPAPKK
jgi:large subunit ribosomal protein L3